jgi:hypothetical protein
MHFLAWSTRILNAGLGIRTCSGSSGLESKRYRSDSNLLSLLYNDPRSVVILPRSAAWRRYEPRAGSGVKPVTT